MLKPQFSVTLFARLWRTALLAAGLALAPLAALAQPPSLVPPPPKLKSVSYLLVDAATGQSLVEANADHRLPPASLTKIMTSYVAAEALERGIITPEDQVEVSVKAWQAEGSRMFIREGTRVKMMDILRGIVVQSGNDASIALAEHLAGTEDAFVDLMNDQAQHLGMDSTNFINATGLPHPNHYTTARDLALLTRALIKGHPEHYQLYKEKDFTYGAPGEAPIWQRNRNPLLARDSAVDGVKTGHTQAAGYCLVASAQRGGTRLISVIMGASSEERRLAESQRLLSYGFRHYETVALYKPMEPVRSLRVWGGLEAAVAVGLADGIELTLPKGMKGELAAQVSTVSELHAPVAEGQEIGALTVALPDGKEETRTLVALGNVGEAGFFSWLLDALWLVALKLTGQDPLAAGDSGPPVAS